jgi:hypothetical protein
MKLVYTHENLFLLSNVKALLEAAGIEVLLRNEYAGGGRGELPVFETWPELWIEKERDYARARAIIEAMHSTSRPPEWACSQCGESNDPSFEFCWRCGAGQGSS